MKVIAVEQAKVLDLVPIEEFRPVAGVYLPDFISAIGERYRFISGPKDLLEAMSTGAKFQQGVFRLKDEDIVIQELGLYADGIIFNTFHTNFSDIILEDFFEWAKAKFKLKERTSPIRRTYASVLVLEYEHEIETGLGKLSKIGKLLSDSLESNYGWKHQYSLQRLAFAVDPIGIQHLRTTQFFIERRVQYPYKDNRFYSGAPLPTDQHRNLLEAIERELLSEC